jgi:CHAD domain-containing protein
MSNEATAMRETERKYDVQRATADPSRLVGEDARSADRQKLRAVYFDTHDLSLLRSRVTLRRREGGHDSGWHLKLPADGDTREEIRLPLAAGTRTPPAELVELTRVFTRGRPLGPVAQLDTDRRRWVMSDARGRDLAELTQDDVSAHTMGARTRAESWREVEVELGERGQVKLLDRIERKLLKGGALRSKSASKVGRLLAPDVPAAPMSPVKPGSAGAAVLDYLSSQAARIRALDAQVRRDTPDAVHQMRVTARRMRSALQAYRRILDREQTEPLVAELKWLGKRLDAARDAEVIEQRLLAAVAALPDELALGPVNAQITRVLQRRRSDGRKRALAALDSGRYLRLHDSIDQLLADPPLTRNAARPARRELPRSVAKAWKRTRAGWRAVSAGEGAERDEALHETRKAAKRLRYAVEVAQPCIGKPANRTRRRLKKLNSRLGDHQDTVVARPVIRQLAVEAHREGGNGFTYGLLYGRQEAEAARTEQALPSVWRKLDRAKTLGWLRA